MSISDAEDKFYTSLSGLGLTKEQKTKIWTAARKLVQESWQEQVTEWRTRLVNSVQLEFSERDARRVLQFAQAASELITTAERIFRTPTLRSQWKRRRDELFIDIGLVPLGEVGEITSQGELCTVGIADINGKVLVTAKVPKS